MPLFDLSRSIRTAIFVTLTSMPVHAQDPSLSDSFGFQPLELFKLKDRSTGVLATDLTGDGRLDLLSIDNSSSRLDLLIQRDPLKAADTMETAGNINGIPSDPRFEIRRIPVDLQVTSLVVGDLNHDNLRDIVYFGAPDTLVTRLQTAQNDWSEKSRLRLPDVALAGRSLACGDLSGDGRDDLVVLGKKITYVIYQDEQGGMETPRQLFNTSEKLSVVQIRDINGDGRRDLTYRSDGEKSPSFCVRFQNEAGQLGPEIAFQMPPTRGFVLHDVDGKPGEELLSIDGRTGRVQLARFEKPRQAADAVSSRLLKFGFGSEGRVRGRDVAAGDLDGDGLTDVVISDPAAARVLLFQQIEGTGLDLGTSCPSFNGVTEIRILPAKDDHPAALVVLSSKENAIGLSTIEKGRLSFPVAVDVPRPEIAGITEFEIAAIELGDLNGDGNPELIYCGIPVIGRSKSDPIIAALTRKDDSWTVYPLSDSGPIRFEESKPPSRIVAVDANQDNRRDLLAFFGDDREPILLLQDPELQFDAVKTEGGIQLGAFGPGAFDAGRNGDALRVAQDRFARHVRLDDQRRWQVIEQYNADESEARISGVVALDLDERPGEEIVLIDSGIQRLRIYRRDDQDLSPWKEVEMGDFSYEASRVADLNHDGRPDLLLLGRGSFAVLLAGHTSPRLVELAAYQSTARECYFSDLAAGDLNGDGRADIAVVDSRQHAIEILDLSAQQKLSKALRFRVFESKSFSSPGQGGAEPREIQLADVTDDRQTDLLLLAHDRLLLYPQDAGPKPASETNE